MAAEIGANVELAKRGGLLHDIGKVLVNEIESTCYCWWRICKEIW